MPANNRTTNIDLNQWKTNEYPKREDFNLDNNKIDAKFGSHESRIKDLETSTSNQSMLESIKSVDGAQSGLDADLLDGQEGDYYVYADNHQNGTNNKVFTAVDKAKLDGIQNGATADQTAEEILELIKTVDSSGSGIDADYLDGKIGSTSSTANTYAQRDSLGDLHCRLLRSQYTSVTSTPNYLLAQHSVGTGDNYARPVTLAQLRASIGTSRGSQIFNNDNIYTYWGTNNDFRIGHNGANTILRSLNHGGSILMQGENLSGENRALVYCDPDGGVDLYHAGLKKFETESYGAYVTGDIRTSTALKTSSQYLAGAINELFQSVSSGKTTVASAITDMGVSTSSSASFTTMAANIKKINTGHYATGTSNIASFSATLGWRPKYVIVRGATDGLWVFSDVNFTQKINVTTSSGTSLATNSRDRVSVTYNASPTCGTDTSTMTATGFTVACDGVTISYPLTWEAFGA